MAQDFNNFIIFGRVLSFSGKNLKLFIPDNSRIVQDPYENISVGETWYKCPENLKFELINYKYDIW